MTLHKWAILCTRVRPTIVGVHKMNPYQYVHRLLQAFSLVHKIVPIVSYVLLWVHHMQTKYCEVLLLYITYIQSVICTITGPSYVHRLLWGLTPAHKMVIVAYVLFWVHLMYTDHCGVLLLYIRWSLYIECHAYYYGSILCRPIIVGSYSCTQDGYSVICTVMGHSYVHQLLWGLTLVHNIYIVSYVPLWAHIMYTDYCRILLLHIR